MKKQTVIVKDRGVIEYAKLFKAVDKIDDIEQLDEIAKSIRDLPRMRLYWQLRERALNHESEIERKRALIKCQLIQKQYVASIPINKRVNRFSTPHGIAGIFISAYAKLGKNCTILQHVIIGSNTMLDSKNQGFPVVGDNVFIGAGAMIIGNVKVGNNVRIGANCIVTQDVPDNSVCVLSGTKTIVKKEPLINKFVDANKYRQMMREKKL